LLWSYHVFEVKLSTLRVKWDSKNEADSVSLAIRGSQDVKLK